jgi:hypothetical protein
VDGNDPCLRPIIWLAQESNVLKARFAVGTPLFQQGIPKKKGYNLSVYPLFFEQTVDYIVWPFNRLLTIRWPAG